MKRNIKNIYGTAYAGQLYRNELKQVRVKEADYLIKKNKKQTSYFEKLLDEKIPAGLQNTLENAFAAGFKFIYSQGSDYIKKTYSQKSIEKSEDKSQEAKKRLYTDMGITLTEGAGLGVVGMGLVDIPIFIGVLLRNIYQIGEVYGFDCDSKAENLYALKLIEAALIRGRDAEDVNDELDELSRKIDEEGFVYYGLMDDQIKRSAVALSDDMLYMKFVQKIPIVGAVGGYKNFRCMKKVGEYAEIKYHKRNLLKLISERENHEIKELVETENDI